MLMNFVFTLDSVFLQVVSTEDSELIRAQQTSMFYSYIVLLIYVYETIYLLGNLLSSRFMSIVLWPRMTHLVLKMHVVGEGPGATLSFETSPFSN